MLEVNQACVTNTEWGGMTVGECELPRACVHNNDRHPWSERMQVICPPNLCPS